ncbi:MAG: 23S rRNA (guanosine(2251)-2'-O)-methyltransferase RlmB [Acutalibacteraceae bacterium]
MAEKNNVRSTAEDIIAGRNPVNEALKSGRAIDSLYVLKGQHTGTLSAIIAKAKGMGITIKECDVKKLDYMCAGAVHQGVVAVAAVKEYSSVDDILAYADRKGESPFIIILDEIEDPHNLGAIIRTAECAGAHGIIIPKRRSAGLTFTVGKASAGAVEYLPVARVTNISVEIDKLKEKGVWIYCADMDGTTWCQTDLTGPIALVIGNEGSGVSRLVKEKCDGVLSLPLLGRVSSLNASVAAGIITYEISRQRNGIKAK